MPTYIYKAKRGPTETVRGEIEATSQDHAISIIEGMGIVPVSVIEKTADQGISGVRVQGSGDRGHQGTGGKVQGSGGRVQAKHASLPKARTQDIDIFTRQLASLIKGGIPLLRALSLISKQAGKKALQRIVEDISRQIGDGKMLSEAMEKYPAAFNNLYLSMVKAGEKSGTLDVTLNKLVEYREKEQDMKWKIQAAMAYPVFVIVVGACTIFVMLTYFLPKLTVVFKTMKQGLPLPTKILIGVSDFMSHNWPAFVILFVLLFALGIRTKQGSREKFFSDLAKLHLPFVKEFVKNSEIAKFARTLGVLLKNGIPVSQAMELAANILDNDLLRERLNMARKDIINQGCTLSDSLKKTNIFPVFALNMIMVGEEGGKLEESLIEIANVYEREIDQSVKIMSSLIEPFLILVVGAVVGFIVFAMLLPIFNMGSIGAGR